MSISEIIATFDNTHHALRFEKTLKENEIKLTVMPVPREVSASCGLSVKFSLEKLEDIKALTADYEILVKKYYEIILEDGKRRYLAID
ncbi:MAG TPA: DUF3343 domain-containing protein [Patescibacteria group bacterium]|jgi:hypothetical protein|nr:DUF3343 domain-containing protein [Patescibacteria group bacterium]